MLWAGGIFLLHQPILIIACHSMTFCHALFTPYQPAQGTLWCLSLKLYAFQDSKGAFGYPQLKSVLPLALVSYPDAQGLCLRTWLD